MTTAEPDLDMNDVREATVLDTKRRLKYQSAAKEAPRVMFLCIAIIAAFDVVFIAVAGPPPVGYLLSDLIQALYVLVGAIAIQRGKVPQTWVPALFASAIVVNNLAMLYQYTLVGYTAIGVTLLLMAAYGGVTLFWRPFLISAALMVGVTGTVLISTDPVEGPAWTLTAATGIALSATMLYSRNRIMGDLATAQAEIHALATRDPLTGLLNRRGLYQSVPILARLAQRKGEPLFAIFIDVTGLKQVNDNHGHDSGDRVLIATSEALKSQVRDADLACRWGGDEMIVIGAGEAPAPDQVAERLAATVVTDGLEQAWHPAFWVGTATSDSYEIDELIARADSHMYLHRD